MAASFSDLAKAGLERALGQRVWLERAAPQAQVRAFLDKLRPMEPDKPLVRVGSAGDGGYLVPDDFDGLESCISPGVSDNADFDLEMAQRGLPVHMIDGSIQAPPLSHANFTFYRQFVDVVDDTEHISLNTLCDRIGARDYIVQMDIEGAEYKTLLDLAPEHLARFRTLIVEFHGVHNIFARPFLQIADAVATKLLRTHSVVHIHPNNCCGKVSRHGLDVPKVLEVTFYRTDRGVRPASEGRSYPHPLDADNVCERETLVLPRYWW